MPERFPMISVRRVVAWLLSGFGVLAISSILAASVLAQAADATRSRISVVQPRVQISLNPSGAAEGELRFTYEGAEPTTAQVWVLHYQIGPDGPSSQEPAASPPSSGSRWITLSPSQVELQPGATVTIRYRVEVPADATPGDHSTLVMMETADTSLRAGARLTVNVPGPAHRQVELLSFNSVLEPLRLWLFDSELPIGLPLFDGGPIQFRAQLHNQGDVQVTAGGTIQIGDPFGNQVAQLSLPEDQIFPGDVATFTTRWFTTPLVGLLRADLVLETGDATVTASERLLIVPWQQLLVALLLALGLRLLLPRGFGFRLPQRGRARVEQPRLAYAAAGGGDRLGESPMASQKQPAAHGVDNQSAPASAVESIAARPALPPASTPDQLDVEELVRWGQQAARAGDRLVAYRLFVQALQIDSSNEEAWLWRAGTSEQPEEAIACLERVLEINPHNARAQRGIEDVTRRFAQGALRGEGVHSGRP